MAIFDIPDWVKKHLFKDKKFDDLTAEEIGSLRNALARFCPADPVVSVVIPAWNEENNIYRTLSSLSASTTRHLTEIIVINNNSTDRTQKVLDDLGIKSYLQPVQGTPHARQMGLDMAKGKYHLCADSDTMYPPAWIDLMVEPMIRDTTTLGVYGTYSFIPPAGQNRFGLLFYELVTLVIIYLRKKKKEYMNVYGFNMGFVTQAGQEVEGFRVKGNRVYANVVGSDFANEAEDGRMALNLSTLGQLHWVTHPKARVFTSPRRLLDDGSITKAFINRAKRQLGIH
ncbi:MAG: glycosyltransferase family 2 protein [Bacteroidetes bacterium]|nr:glycosyltransferase family 2 protein [Bacteroidota bacterium]